MKTRVQDKDACALVVLSVLLTLAYMPECHRFLSQLNWAAKHTRSSHLLSCPRVFVSLSERKRERGAYCMCVRVCVGGGMHLFKKCIPRASGAWQVTWRSSGPLPAPKCLPWWQAVGCTPWQQTPAAQGEKCVNWMILCEDCQWNVKCFQLYSFMASLWQWKMHFQ